MLSMTDEQLNAGTCDLNILLTEGDKQNNTQTRHGQEFDPPLPKPLKFRSKIPKTELTYAREDDNRGSFGLKKKEKKKKSIIVRLSASLSVDSKVTSPPLLPFKSPILFVFDKSSL